MISLDPEGLSQELFGLDPSIRYVGILDGTKNLALSKMRPGIKSVTSESDDRYFMNIIPSIVLGAFERLTKYAGDLEIVAARLDNVSLFMFYSDSYVIVTSAESNAFDSVLSKLRDWRLKANRKVKS